MALKTSGFVGRRAVLLVGVLVLLVPEAMSASTTVNKGSSKVIDITENSFDAEIGRGAYFVKVYADWCAHCRHMAPAWEELANELEEEVFVGNINGPNEKALVARLAVQGYPAIFLFRDGKAYEYTGSRGLQHFVSFAREDWKSAKPMPFYKAPNSIVGRIFGRISSLPLLFENMYKHLHNEQGFSDLLIIATVLLVLAISGLIFICCLDVLTVRRSPSNTPLHPHAQ